MPVVISMLRGINVGGHHRITMDALRTVYERLGLRHAQTYLQSGNVVFSTAEWNLVQLASQIADALERNFSFRPEVILRTVSEMRAVVACNPFAARPDVDPSKLLVLFLAKVPAQAARDKLLTITAAPEEFHVGGQEVFMYFPSGMARPTLSPAAVEKVLGTRATGRNWNTVTKLLVISERVETSFSTLHRLGGG